MMILSFYASFIYSALPLEDMKVMKDLNAAQLFIAASRLGDFGYPCVRRGFTALRT